MVDIQLTDITTGTVDGTGVFDKLMSAVKEHIKEEYENGRIKGPDYAQVYLGALQGVLGQSVEYALREKLTEAQAEGALKDIELKEAQIIGLGYDNQVKQQQVAESVFRVNNILPKELEKMTAEILGYGYDNRVKEQQVAESVFRVEYVLPKELEIKESQLIGMLKDNELKDQSIIESTYRVTNLLPKELEQITAQIEDITKGIEIKERSIVVQESELEDRLLTSDKQRLVIDEEIETANKQQAILDVEVQVKSYEKDTLLVDKHETNLKQIEDITKGIELKEEQKLNAYVERVIRDKEATALGLDNSMKLNEEAKKASPGYIYTPVYKDK